MSNYTLVLIFSLLLLIIPILFVARHSADPPFHVTPQNHIMPPTPFHAHHNHLPHMSAPLKDVELCPVCGMPPEYCEYGGKFDLCKPWLKENHLDLYPDLANFEVTEEMAEATLNAINARETTTGRWFFCFSEAKLPRRRIPRK